MKIPPATLAKLAKLGIHSRADLLLHLPLRYEDETRLTPIAALQPGMTAQVQGRVASCEVAFRPRRTLVCRLEDSGSELFLRFLNFYPSQQKQLAVGKQIRAIGDARIGHFGLEMVHPKCSSVGDGTPLPEALTPVYPTTAGLGQSSLRRIIAHALETTSVEDTLPESLLTQLQLPGFAESLRLIHNPPPEISPGALVGRDHPAWKRIKFDELLAQQLSMRIYHHSRCSRSAPPLMPRRHFTSRLIERLPFALTAAQQRALDEIGHDLSQPYPMQRLLLGDVGSGKTIVAVLAALQTIENGYQVAFMAPTEILAEQHYHKLRNWLEPLGLVPAWLSGSHKKAEKLHAADSIASGRALIAIGTHALFQRQISFHRLGLVIVDEQHRFGVEQRLALRKKGSAQITEASQESVVGQEPHQLMMSATPIPRTLAMSYYADLDLSVIDEAPPGRIPVTTKLVSDARRNEVLERVRAACLTGQQAYWVCPLIAESEVLQLQTALDTFQLLTSAFPELRIGLVHGKLESEEKAKVMAAFAAGELHLLVATTVIEVGVDVPNAALMVIDHAERMGLAQLHQLRGRVGRGTAQSMCILLFQQPLSELARARLKIIYENSDGFEIAQQDLRLRGPGELLGSRQSGAAVLRFANLADDVDLLNRARKVADDLLQHHPDVALSHLQRWMPDKHDFLKV